MLWPSELHRSYHRRDDIHARFGGQQQGGISTPADVPGSPFIPAMAPGWSATKTLSKQVGAFGARGKVSLAICP